MNEVKTGDLIAFYGTLREIKNPMLSPSGNCTVFGKLLNIGSFPGLVSTNEPREVVGELYVVEGPDVMQRLDSYEGYRPDDEAHSLYTRRQIRVKNDKGEEVMAWTYIWNGGHDYPEVASGDWFRR